MKLASNALDVKLKLAIALLNSRDNTDKTLMIISQNRVPRGVIMRNEEGTLGRYYGNSKRRRRNK